MRSLVPLLSRPGWVLPNATLDLDFAHGRYFGRGSPVGNGRDQLLATTRASVGMAQTASGMWLSFDSGIPRITDLGLLVEESRTNSIRNNSMVNSQSGSVVPTPWTTAGTGTLTRSWLGLGTENGLPYIDMRVSGTTSTTSSEVDFETTTQIAATQGQTWAASLGLKLLAGSTANLSAITLSHLECSNTGSFLTKGDLDLTALLSAQYNRFKFVRTTTNASIAFIRPALIFTHTSGVAIDITVRIYAPQLELGGFCTSPILTTTAAATRAADKVLLVTPSLVSILAGTVFAEWYSIAGPVSALERAFGIWQDANNYIAILNNNASNKARGNVRVSGSNTASLNTTNNIAADVVYRGAFAYRTDDFAAAFTAALQSTILTSNSGAVPSATIAGVGIGNRGDGGEIANGYIRRVAWQPGRVSNPDLLKWAQVS